MSPRIHARAAILCAALWMVAASPAPDDLARETAVFEATIRQQIDEHLDRAARANSTVLCIGIDPGASPQSPSREFMARLGKKNVLRRLTECEASPAGAVEVMSQRPAVLVTVGPIDWRADDEAWVTVTWFRTGTRSGIRRYRVVHEAIGWVSLGQILIDGPA